MKITGNEKAIVEMIRANDDLPIAIYEVECFDALTEWFTELGEAERYFDSCTVTNDSTDEYWVLRELIVDMLDERTLDVHTATILEEWNGNNN